MEKIPTVFVRNPQNMKLVTREIMPGCEWVFGSPAPIITRKVDGTNVRVTIKDGQLVKLEKRRNPTREEKAQGAEPGYVDASRDDPNDKYIFAAADATTFHGRPDGAHPMEAVGPKIQGGVESDVPGLYAFTLQPFVFISFTPSFESIRDFLTEHCGSEGIVFRESMDTDSRLAKIKRRDFGLPWPVK